MLFYKLENGVLELGGSTWTGASIMNTTPPTWPWDADRASILEVRPHDNIIFDPEVTSMCKMFYNCENLEKIDISTIFLGNITHWADVNLYAGRGIAQGCTKLSYFKCSSLPLAGINFLGGGSSSNAAFKNAAVEKDFEFVCDMSLCRNFKGLFFDCKAKSYNFTGKVPEHVENAGAMFYNNFNLEKLDLTKWGFEDGCILFTITVTNPIGIFSSCKCLKELKIGKLKPSSFGSSNGSWLHNCSSVSKYLHLSVDLSHVENGDYLFASFGGNSIVIDGSGITDRCTRLKYMIADSSLYELPSGVEEWDTSFITNIDSFAKGSQVRVLDFTKFSSLERVTSMQNICTNATNLYKIKFKTPRLLSFAYNNSLLSGCSYKSKILYAEIDCEDTTSLERVFWDCEAEKIVLKVTNSSNVTTIESMFRNCTKLKTIECTSDFSSLTDSTVFTGDTLLVGGAGTTYSSANVGASYAKPDDGAGYFSSYSTDGYLFIVEPAGGGKLRSDYLQTDTTSFFINNVQYSDPSITVEHVDDALQFQGWYLDDQKISAAASITVDIPAVGTGTVSVITAKYFVEGVIYPDPLEGGGTSGPSGPGGGSWDESSDVIDVGDHPALSGVTKFTNMYVISQGNLDVVADYLWGATFEGFWENIWGSPMDYVTSLAIMPVTPDTEVSPEEVKVGKFTIDDSEAYRITNRWVRVDLGTINCREFSGSYLDYAPYTRVQIYLPFVGYRDLDVDMFQNGELQVIYEIDTLTGDLVAKILTAAGGVTSQFQGNCKSELPITGQDNSKLGSSIMSGIVTLAAAGMAAPTAGAAVGAMAGSLAGATGDSVMSSKPDATHGSSLGATGGLLGTQTPYLIWTIPRVSIPADYSKDNGLPINARYTLANLTGFTVCSDVHIPLVSDMTAEEAAEIEALLKGGVYL